MLPRPAPPFAGTIGRTAAESTPDFPKAIEAPKGAPNVLLIMTDDVGFGASSTFGGAIPTPTFDQLAKEGLRYNTFHTTALCSPTRAALITGRNHHTNATGVITEMGTGYPGYNSLMPKSSGTVGEILKQNGYNTAWFGKNHNVPDWQIEPGGAVRPLAHRPGLRVFLRLHRRRHRPVASGHLRRHQARSRRRTDAEATTSTRDLADHADRVDSPAALARAGQAVLRLLRAGPDPRAAPRAQGMDREVQGPVRPGLGQAARGNARAADRSWASFPPAPSSRARPKEIPAWDSLQRRPEEALRAHDGGLCRAAWPTCDYNIGRVIEAVEDTGELDNTLIIYIHGRQRRERRRHAAGPGQRSRRRRQRRRGEPARISCPSWTSSAGR